jgi:hypothetical protein
LANSDHEHLTFEGHVVHKPANGKSVLFYIEDLEEEHWFPLSQVELDDDETSIMVPRWLAREKGI